MSSPDVVDRYTPFAEAPEMVELLDLAVELVDYRQSRDVDTARVALEKMEHRAEELFPADEAEQYKWLNLASAAATDMYYDRENLTPEDFRVAKTRRVGKWLRSLL